MNKFYNKEEQTINKYGRKYSIAFNGKPYHESFLMNLFYGEPMVFRAFIIPFCLLYAIPWEYFYNQGWYQNYIVFISEYLSVLNNIEYSDIIFKQYAIAYLAFFDVLILFLACIFFVHFIVNMEILNTNPILEKGLKYHFLSTVFSILLGWGIIYILYSWDGNLPRAYPNFILEIKPAFITISILYLHGLMIFVFTAVSSFKLLIKKILILLNSH